MLGMLAVAVLLTGLGRSLGQPEGFRQAAVPLSFAVVAGPFLIWALRGPDGGPDWARLGPPVRSSWGPLIVTAVLGMALVLASAILASRLPGYRELLERQRDIASWSGTPELARAVFFVAAMPAFLEELYFRGYLLYRLRRAWGPGPALFTQAALFAALHGPGWPVAAAIGLLNGLLTLRSGSLWPAFCLHLLNNLAVVLVLKTGA